MASNEANREEKAVDVTTSAQTRADAGARKPYSRPRLRQLGSVRELTLGSTGPAGDGGPTLMPRM